MTFYKNLHKLIFILAFISCQVLAKPPAHILPIESYANQAEISMLRISPSGKNLALRYTKDGRDLILIKDIATGKNLGGANIDNINPQNIYFIDEKRLILRVSEYKKLAGFRGKHNVSTAFVLDVGESSQLRQLLTPGKGVYLGQTSLGSIVGLSSDKKFAFMPAYVENHSRSTNSDPVMSLMRVNLNKDKKPKKVTKGRVDGTDYFVNENGEVLARERYSNAKNLHRIQAYNNGKYTDIFSEETPYMTKSFVGLTPDKKSLVVLARNKDGEDAYYTMSLADGSLSKALFVKKGLDIENVLVDIQRVVYGVQYSGFKPSYAFFDKKLEKKVKAIQKAFPDDSVDIIDYTPNWKQLLIHVSGNTSSGDYYLYNGKNLNYLASSFEKILPEHINPITIASYKAKDGLNIPTLLTMPKNKSKKPKALPTIMLPHGGPESYDRYGFDWLAQYFANRGFAVIQPQFRGSEGFGLKHILAGRGEWGQKMQTDLSDAVEHFAEKGIIDPKRVCIVGISYGGYAALAGATFTPDVYKCAISINGVSDLEEMIDDEKYDNGSRHWVVSYWQEVINKKKLGDDFLDSISPVKHIDKIKIPILLIHGEIDKVVRLSQSEDMYDEIEDADKKVKFIELEDEGHYLRKNESRLKTLKAIESFVNKNI